MLLVVITYGRELSWEAFAGASLLLEYTVIMQEVEVVVPETKGRRLVTWFRTEVQAV